MDRITGDRILIADPGAFDRITVEPTPSGCSHSWRIKIKEPPGSGAINVRKLSLSRDELIALAEHIAEAVL